MPFIGNQPALSYTSFAKQDFTTSATTSYTLSQPVANENEIALFINFVRQEPTTAYTANGTSLTLTSATSASDDMYAIFLGKAVQTVNAPAGSVGISQLSATGTKDSTTFLRGDNTFASAGSPSIVDNGTATAITIDSSQNVGIGTSSPSRNLQVAGTNAVVAIKTTNDTYSSVFFGDTSADNIGKLIYDHTDNSLQTIVNNAERMRIDSSGNLKFNSGYGSVATAYGCRAWVNFNGQGTVAIRDGKNVSSITDNGTGNYTINFITAMPDANYSIAGTLREDVSGGVGQTTNRVLGLRRATSTVTTTSITIGVTNFSSGASDAESVYVTITR